MKIDTLPKLLAVLGILMAMILIGCVSLTERLATRLAEKSLHHRHALDLIEGDVAAYHSCLHRRGGACQGDAATPLPATGATRPATPTRASLHSHLAASVAALPAEHPAQLAKGALEHPVLATATSLHNHLRGHKASKNSSVAATKGGNGSHHTLRMQVSVGQMKSFQEQIHRTTAAGGWHALASHAAGRLARSSPGSAGHDELRSDHRRAVFIKKYVEAYFRNGRFLAVDFTIEASQATAAIARELTEHAQRSCQIYNSQSSAAGGVSAPATSSSPPAAADCGALARALYDEVRRSNSSIDHHIVKISQTGFVSRSGSYSAQFPSFEIDIDPLSHHLLTLTTGSGDSVESIDFTHVGSQLVRVVLEAVFDAHEGLPAVSQATARDLGDESLPLLQLPLGHISSDDFNAMTKVNSHVESATGVVLNRVIAGIGPLSLNNEPLEQLIVTVITTSVLKAVEKATWCWYACNLDVELKKAEKEVEKKLKAFEKRAKRRVRLDLDIGN